MKTNICDIKKSRKLTKLSLRKEKREKMQITKIRNKNWDNTTKFTEIKIKECYE